MTELYLYNIFNTHLAAHIPFLLGKFNTFPIIFDTR